MLHVPRGPIFAAERVIAKGKREDTRCCFAWPRTPGPQKVLHHRPLCDAVPVARGAIVNERAAGTEAIAAVLKGWRVHTGPWQRVPIGCQLPVGRQEAKAGGELHEAVEQCKNIPPVFAWGEYGNVYVFIKLGDATILNQVVACSSQCCGQREDPRVSLHLPLSIEEGTQHCGEKAQAAVFMTGHRRRQLPTDAQPDRRRACVVPVCRRHVAVRAARVSFSAEAADLRCVFRRST
eukprot:3300931-Prymnesium_polylepis.3